MKLAEYRESKYFFERQPPGLVRLRGLMLLAVIERKCLETGERVIFEPETAKSAPDTLAIPEGAKDGLSVIDQVTRSLLVYAVDKHRTRLEAAKWLGLGKSTMYTELARLGIQKAKYERVAGSVSKTPGATS